MVINQNLIFQESDATREGEDKTSTCESSETLSSGLYAFVCVGGGGDNILSFCLIAEAVRK